MVPSSTCYWLRDSLLLAIDSRYGRRSGLFAEHPFGGPSIQNI